MNITQNKIKHKTLTTLALTTLAIFIFSMVSMLSMQQVAAADEPAGQSTPEFNYVDPVTGKRQDIEISSDLEFTNTEASRGTADTCGGVDVAIDVDCDDTITNPIYAYTIAIINFLAAGVGIVVVTMVAVGGIQYMTAGGNPQITQDAIKRISNALIGLVLFIFIWAFLQWLIPSGAFNNGTSSGDSSTGAQQGDPI